MKNKSTQKKEGVRVIIKPDYWINYGGQIFIISNWMFLVFGDMLKLKKGTKNNELELALLTKK